MGNKSSGGSRGSRGAQPARGARPPQPKQQAQKKVVDAKSNQEGDITHVKIEGNQGWTPLETAIKMADQGELGNVHSVEKPGGGKYLRSNPDSQSTNNLDEMAKD